MNRKIVKTAMILLILFSFFLPPIKDYYSKFDNYITFDKELSYRDLFYYPTSNWWRMYGIGESDIETSMYLLENPFSKEKEYYDKKGIVVYPASTVKELILLLNDCTFKPIEKNKAFLLSLLFNYQNNITTVTLSNRIVNEQLKKENSVSNKDMENINIGFEISSDEIGVINSGIFSFMGKTYLAADYVIPGDVIVNYNYNDVIDFSYFDKCMLVFEISDSDSENEIVERKYGFQTARYDSYDSSPYGVLNFVLLLLAILGLVINKNTRHDSLS